MKFLETGRILHSLKKLAALCNRAASGNRGNADVIRYFSTETRESVKGSEYDDDWPIDEFSSDKEITLRRIQNGILSLSTNRERRSIQQSPADTSRARQW